MKIRHISVKNFRGIKNLDFSIHDEGPVCIIGSGDSCKTTILEAVRLALSAAWTESFDDSDFYNLDYESLIKIQVTLGDLGNDDYSKELISEKNYGLYIRGYKDGKIFDEPEEDHDKVLTISLSVDKALDPNWEVVAPDRLDPAHISNKHRKLFGTALLKDQPDWNFNWSRNSLLTRLTDTDRAEDTEALAGISRKIRQSESLPEEYQVRAKELEGVVSDFGVKTKDYAASLDINSANLRTSAISLHDDSIPLKRHGLGTKRLIAMALQKNLHENKNIILIDELEYGLEPNRISQVIKKIKNGDSQHLITTHSPVVVREVSADNIYVLHNKEGSVDAVKLTEGLSKDSRDKIQANIRKNAEDFLADRIIVCEGATEKGLMRAFDGFRQGVVQKESFSALGAVSMDGGGMPECSNIALKLAKAGYDVALLCDSDKPVDNKELLAEQEVPVFQWAGGRAVEDVLFYDMPSHVRKSLLQLVVNRRSAESVIDQVSSIAETSPGRGIDSWNFDDPILLKALVKAAKSRGKEWFKSTSMGISAGETIFESYDDISSDSDFVKITSNVGGWLDGEREST